MLARKALAGTAAAPKEYVEDVFSTYLYTGNGSTQTITNNIDLSTKGGMVWVKRRSGVYDHSVFDTVRGAQLELNTNLDSSATTRSTGITSFGTTGFTTGSFGGTNANGETYASWTFRKAEKFFDVVTYTGNGSARTISHNLGSTPGCIIVKRTDTTGDWYVYHRSNTAAPETDYLLLNSTAATADLDTVWNDTSPTSTVFSVGTNTGVNANSGTYVAYLFAHDAGGFGDAGSDSIIKCGSYTGNGSATGPTITLDWEPQWVLVKRASGGTESWYLMDTMRGFTTDGNVTRLYPNDSLAEDASLVGPVIAPTATGFRILTSDASFNTNGNTYVYIAIRRGPMKTPTSATSVFTPTARTGTGASATFTGAGFPVDSSWIRFRGSLEGTYVQDRLRGPNRVLDTTAASSESTQTQYITSFASMTGYTLGTNSGVNGSSSTYINWDLRRAPGFFDVVCYTGTGANRTVSHNLGVAPELMIVKSRDQANPEWRVYSATLGATKHLKLNTDGGVATDSTMWNDTAPTSSVFTVGTASDVNNSSSTFVAYLFGSVNGVSKVGTYTGNGSSQTINCSFTNGARFVLIRRTDSTGNWFVFDTARGIVSGNDPFLYLNTTGAEVTTRDAVDPDNSGFIVNNDNTNFPINVNTGTYIYLAIA